MMVVSTNTSTNQSAPHSINGNVANQHNGHDELTTLPKGKYTLVGVDIDTTGRRLIDEIIQLAAFTPNDHYGQYIMPYMNLNSAARQRHQIRVISIGFYRMLKSTKTYKIIKSKSEIAALRDFLDWLEALKAKDTGSQGVILVYHEQRKFIPYMILESLKKYNLLDRFLNTVKSFANGLNLAKTNLDADLKNYTLRKLSKYLKDSINSNNVNSPHSDVGKITLAEAQSSDNKNWRKTRPNKEHEEFEGNATVRAKLAYEVAFQLSNRENRESSESTSPMDKMLTALQPYTQPIECDLNELQVQNEILKRQNSFRPVFLDYFKSTLYNRLRAVKFRIILAEHSCDLETLGDIWAKDKRDGLVKILEDIEELKSAEKIELANLFDSYYDTTKTTIKPVVITNNNRRRNTRIKNTLQNLNGNTSRSVGNEQGAGGDKPQQASSDDKMPDSTMKSPKNRRPRRQFSRFPNNKTFSKSQMPNRSNHTTSQTNNTAVTSITAPLSNQ